MNQNLAALMLCTGFSTLCYADSLWQIEIDEIKRIGIQAVHDSYPELPLDDLVVETGVTVMCGEHPALARYRNHPSRQLKCQAMMSVSPQSTVIEKRYTDENGNCRLVRTREPITVYVFEDRTARVGGRGVIKRGDHSVACPEDFAGFLALPYNKSFKSAAKGCRTG